MEINSPKTYWKGLEELSNDASFVQNAANEFPEYLPISGSSNGGNNDTEQYLTQRRDFLKMLGFGVAAVSLAACETPVKKAIPYLNKPEDIDPSIPNYYASTYAEGGDYASILVKTKDGRPVKIEGNKLSTLTQGGVSSKAQASVLNLYDNERLSGPIRKSAAITWEEADASIKSSLKEISASGQGIRIVTNSIQSGTLKKSLADFALAYSGTQIITYDPISYTGICQAYESAYGMYAIPHHDFSKVSTVVSIGADFLGTWLAPSIQSRQFAKTRKLGKDKKTMSRLYSFESNLSLTGANADHRTPIKPSEVGTLVLALYNAVASATGNATVSGAATDVRWLKEAASDLLASKGQSLVVCGSNDVSVQQLVVGINRMVEAYGNTIDLTRPTSYFSGDDRKFSAFISELKEGKIGAVLFLGCNPVYDHTMGASLAEALSKAKLTVSTADRVDETAASTEFVCPGSHYLESWSDAEPVAGFASLAQPSIAHIFKTRQVLESLLRWSGSSVSAYDYLQAFWRDNYFSKQTAYLTFTEFWNNTLHDGVFEYTPAPSFAPTTFDVSTAAPDVASRYKPANGFQYTLYTKVTIGDGRYANNPWLQEAPDPVSKACWDNYAAVSKKMANELGVVDGDLVKVDVEGKPSLELPILVQPGQAYGVVSIALGYGRTAAGKAGNNIGKNAYPWCRSGSNGTVMYYGAVTGIAKTGSTKALAQTQTHHTIMGRAVVQESTLNEYQKDAKAGRYFPKVATYEGSKKPMEISLWNEHNRVNHNWGMVIDLNSCFGCGACTIACQAENNVPVVGRQEVINRREMHWIRIDRYYSSDADPHDLKGLEEASENPDVVFQPMMCQHCNHAPCETVCPVLATTHSSEGLNQMTYNRCIGTRYCANNCPYKVRRFNWFKYHNNVQFADVNVAMNNDLGKMVLNPDVTVRSRGVMEKCTFCVQRIQEGKLTAKKEKRRPVDGEIQTACAQSCPSEAIVFGDLNDPDSRIAKLLSLEYYEDGSKMAKEDRAFHVLEEINVQPNVSYLTKIRNKKA
jgi:molybdopterin-containing oxidoreductase family iron-sulfur binding subunit